MNTTNKAPKIQQLFHVGDCLCRSSITGIYCAIFKRDGRQVKRSLKTADREMAKRRIEELRQQVDRLTAADAKTLVFAEYSSTGELVGGVAKRWLDATTVSIKPKTARMYHNSVKMLAKQFGAVTVRNMNLRQIEDWATARSTSCGARTFNADLEVLRRILDYACRHGLLLENPGEGNQAPQAEQGTLGDPDEEQFRRPPDSDAQAERQGVR